MKKYDIVAKVGEYQKDGATKAKYKNVGAVILSEDGSPYIMLDRTFNPAGMPGSGESVPLSLFDPKQQASGGSSGQAQSSYQQPRQGGGSPF